MADQIIDGVKAPAGGFQQGGWYEGRQYWGGTLSQKGVINSLSDQVGAGQKVSAEVNRAGSIAAGLAPDAYQKFIDGPDAAPTSAEALPSYLDTYQNAQYGLTVPGSSLKAPTPINRLEMLKEQRSQMGVDQLETELNALKGEERLIQANSRANQVTQEGKPVALNVMSGRVTEEKRQAQMDLDFLNVRKSTLVDELSTKYNAISTYINYAGLDYQDAKMAYDSEFSKNLQIAQFISGEKQNSITNARANLTTIMNAVTAGNMSYSSMSNDEKLQIQKLEIQSGLPVGTMSHLTMNMKDKLMGFSDDKTQALVLNGNGGFSTISTGFKPSGSAGGSPFLAVSDDKAWASVKDGNGGFVGVKTGIPASSSSSSKTNSDKWTAAENEAAIKSQLAADAKSGTPLIEYSGKGPDIMSIYRTFLTADDIYSIYNANSPYGTAKESLEELRKFKGIGTSTGDAMTQYYSTNNP